MQRPERHGTPRNVVWLDTSNLDIVLRRRRTPRHFSGRCVSESVERLCPSQWFLRSKGGLYQCPRSWIGSVKLEKNFVSVKKQGFFSESMVSEVCAVGQRNIRFIRMFMSVSEVKETFGQVWEEGLFQCQRKIYVSYLWMSSWLWLSLARNEFDMSVEFKHITYVNVYMYVYNVVLLFLLERLFVCWTGTPPMCTRPMIMTMGWCIPPRMKDPTLVDTPLWRRVGELPSEGQTQWCWGQGHPQG